MVNPVQAAAEVMLAIFSVLPGPVVSLISVILALFLLAGFFKLFF